MTAVVAWVALALVLVFVVLPVLYFVFSKKDIPPGSFNAHGE